MKARLLRKCRDKIEIVNSYGFPADKNDKKVTVIFGWEPIKNSKGKTIYVNYGNAVNRRRKAILEYANEIHLKPWYWHILH